MYDGTTPTKFGRYQVAEPLQLYRLHLHRGQPLKEVDHEPPVPVLDQEDLFSQGIDTSQLVPGAARVDALGSCTCNAGTVSLAERWTTVHGVESLASLDLSTTDAVANEKFAIQLYHAVTSQAGDPAQEWPPTDCGSTGLYVCAELEKRHLATSYKTAHGALDAASLLQGGTVIVGAPWFNAWMEPDANGFVDGNGTLDDFQRAIDSGVAGGHETCITAMEKLSLSATDVIEASLTWFRVRNSWSTAWGDHGSYRVHLSTLQWLAGYADYKQIVV